MAKISPEIFRAYDIRGIHPDQINGQASFAIARGFMKFLKEKQGTEKPTICIGRDARPSSLELFEGFAKGVAIEGGHVVDIGLAMTPALYFAVSHYGYDGGVNITASHNPNPFNGLKIVRKSSIPLGGETGLEDIQKYAQDVVDGYENVPMPTPEEKDIVSDYTAENLELANIEPGFLKDMHIAIDVGNGVAGKYVTALLDKFPGISYTRLYFEPDGNFPNHDPDPTVQKNLEDLVEVMKKEKYTCGLAFDGDADRIVFIDENGQDVDGGLALGLIAKILLRDHPGARILYSVITSRTVPEIIEHLGGKSSMSRVGHTLIKTQMRKEGAFFAGEPSGHYVVGGERFYEVPLVVFLLVLGEIARSGKKLGELLEEIKDRWNHSGVINFKVGNKEAILQTIREKFSNGELNTMDGIRIDYPDWWFIVRPSNTEPLLRLAVEADGKEKLQEKVDLLTGIINGK